MQKSLSPYYPESAVEYWWKDLQLTQAFTELEKMDLSDTPLLPLLAKLGKGLSFLEHLEISKTLKKFLDEDFDEDSYFKEVGFHHTNYLKQSLKVIPLLPKEFLNWAKNKKLSPKDFRVFFGIEEDSSEELLLFFKQVSELEPSKSEGLLILEYAIDLFYKKDSLQAFSEYKNSAQLLKALKKERFLNAFEQDEEIQTQISKIDLGADAKLKTLRQGDSRILHVELKSNHPLKLKTSLERLSKNLSQIEKVWN